MASANVGGRMVVGQDLDGDGIPDVLQGRPGGFNQGGVPMAAANVGGRMVVGQDLDGDGIPDVLQGPPRGFNQGFAPMVAPPQSWSSAPTVGRNGVASPQPSYTMPMAAVNVGGTMVVGQDLDGDGIPDVLQGRPGGFNQGGVPMASANVGGRMMVGQDLDGDGIPDFLQGPQQVLQRPQQVLQGRPTPMAA